MEEKFRDILNLEKVAGVILVSFEGKILFEKFHRNPGPDLRRPDKTVWGSLMPVLIGIREADLIFEHRRIYIRKTPVGHLLVLMEHFGSMAMMRLQCDLLIPTLKETTPPRGLLRWLRKKK